MMDAALEISGLYVIFLETLNFLKTNKRFLSFGNFKINKRNKEKKLFAFLQYNVLVLAMFYSRHDAKNLHFQRIMFTFWIFTWRDYFQRGFEFSPLRLKSIHNKTQLRINCKIDRI